MSADLWMIDSVLANPYQMRLTMMSKAFKTMHKPHTNEYWCLKYNLYMMNLWLINA